MSYWSIWKQLAHCAFAQYLTNKISSITFFLGKVARFFIFLLVIQGIFRFTPTLVGYNKYQVLLFLIMFNIVDSLSQAFLRGIYMFSYDMKEGRFDHVLIKPTNALFVVLTKLTDMLDIIFLTPLVVALAFLIPKAAPLSATTVIAFIVLTIAALIVIFAFHVLCAAIMVRTQESENMIWVYRRIITVGTFPPEVFPPPMRLLFIPIFIATSFPVKGLLGHFSYQTVAAICIISVLFAAFSLVLWRKSLYHYASVSS